jgi:putative transcriptional regulator
MSDVPQAGSMDMAGLQNHFLIAMPAMSDPNFSETVTYICKHDEEGALGVIVNRPSDMRLGEIFRQLELEVVDPAYGEHLVLQGGPVHRERGFVIHSGEREFKSTLRASDGLRVTVSQDVLTAMARGEGPASAVVALGCAGWEPGQLEAEIAANAWLNAPADPIVIFDTPFEQRWAAAAGLLGVDIHQHIHQLSLYAGHA